MKKDFEWLKEEIWRQDVVMDKGYIYTDDLMSIINEVDEPEVLSQEWIDEHEIYYNHWVGAVPVTELQNLLVPKQEEPTQEQVQKYLSEHGIEVVENEPETVADVISDFWKSFERLKEVMSMEVEELEE